MMAQIVAAALVADLRLRAQPASVDSVPTDANKEDHVSMGVARRSRRATPWAAGDRGSRSSCSPRRRRWSSCAAAPGAAWRGVRPVRAHVDAARADRVLAPDIAAARGARPRRRVRDIWSGLRWRERILLSPAREVVTCETLDADRCVRDRCRRRSSGRRVAAVGEEARLRGGAAARAVDCAGGVITPGFVDSHTHAVFGGWRAAEYALRSRGVPYMEIARRGGGINASVRDTRPQRGRAGRS
jgi:hypothetical protein